MVHVILEALCKTEPSVLDVTAAAHLATLFKEIKTPVLFYEPDRT